LNRKSGWACFAKLAASSAHGERGIATPATSRGTTARGISARGISVRGIHNAANPSETNPRRVSERCIGEFKHADREHRNANKPTI
jgi:hypothetical protein